ncbi:hypothetical protein [Actinomadura madurae]|uniref:hypothetical protein n=1 Tax=Actinomadura madurae TaxID=1993 RepID=UPI0020D25A4A|nr:hypothetical protein [Actinomadura madurae]MCP9947312.1 hypothetical protein [Actinomadura madurae]MCP9964074.1 hypothetical protein [Actinomadura madurae]MCP9976548.1 hypothetical protein [Actinomadura madurae]MCQ0011952.1 hypothetical protein [Actinomadura madurae]MCQ0012745.1 hypothetical protein [Actinomadura madurae]
MTVLLRPLIVAACIAAALIAVSGRVHVGIGAGLAVLALWWILSWTIGDSLEWDEHRRTTRRRDAGGT